MLIDNRTEYENGQPKTIFEYFQNRLGQGEKFKLVTGYYSLQTFAKLLPLLDKYENLELVLGHIAGEEGQNLEKFYLKNETLTISDSMDFVNKIPEIITFLKQDKVQIKTTNPEFCHAKVYLSLSKKDYTKNFAISGSSNFTPSGLGQIFSSNIELNHVFETGNNSINELEKWFDELYKKALDNKDEVLVEIEKYYKTEYSPEEIYNLILWYLFNQDVQENIDLDQDKFFSKLKDTVLWDRLYQFQKTGVSELILRLEKFNFGILADGVGLGKTWQTLGVIKYYCAQDLDILVICPAKLQQNWKKYIYNPQNTDYNPFNTDKIKYEVLSSGKLDNPDNLRKYDLIIIDESHNFRNPKSQRYENLIQNLQKDKLTKVLMLSATPINNKINDLKHQFKLGFCHSDNPEVFDFDQIFRATQTELNKLETAEKTKILEAFQPNLIKLISDLSISRNRSLIQKHYPNSNLTFPKVSTSAVHLDDFAKIVNLLFKEDKKNTPKIGFHIYKPSRYLKNKDNLESKNAVENQEERETWLAKMMLFNLLKRLESSTYSFLETMKRMIDYMEDILKANENYKNNKESFKKTQDKIKFEGVLDQDEIEGLEEGLSDIPVVGKKQEFRFDQLNQFYFTNAKKDLEHIKNVYQQVKKEFSSDNKLDLLNGKIQALLKQNKSGKILIFTSYYDTAKYLFDNLTNSNSDLNIALISSSNCFYRPKSEQVKNIQFNQILRSFSPESMIFNELNNEEKSKYSNFQDFWQNYQGKEKNQPIEILIATDCISEGQNLQDCDTIINYDIHWNPVKLIQRNGRIDRIGSKFSQVNIVNFWPGNSLEEVINLKSRIDFKMELVKMAGGADQTDEAENLNSEEIKNNIQVAREKQVLEMLDRDYTEIENLEFGFGDINNLNTFKEEFLENYQKEIKQSLVYNHYPNGIYTATNSNQPKIAWLFEQKISKKTQSKSYKLVISDFDGNLIETDTAKILADLKNYKNQKYNLKPENNPRQNLNKYQEIIKTLLPQIQASEEKQNLQQAQNSNKPIFTPAVIKQENLNTSKLLTWFILD